MRPNNFPADAHPLRGLAPLISGVMPNNQHTRPLWIAALLTSLVAPAGYVLWELALTLPGTLEGQATSPPLVQVLAFSFGVVLLASIVATFVFLLPSVLWLRARNRLTRGRVYVIAVIIGVIITAIYSLAVAGVVLKSWPEIAWLPIAAAFALFSGVPLGLLSGLCFCSAAGITIRSTGRQPATRAGAGELKR